MLARGCGGVLLSRTMTPLAFVGYSGSGKTDLLVRLVRHFAARGEDVAVIKHTHHPANTERRGDTGRFLDAGARETILVSEQGMAAHSDGTMFAFRDAREVLSRIRSRRVLAEGFRTRRIWPSIVVERGTEGRPPIDPEMTLAFVSEVGAGRLPTFSFGDTETIAAFVEETQRRLAPAYDAVVFDLDGTLIDSYRALTLAINHARTSSGFRELTEEEIRGAVGEGIDVLLQRAFAPSNVPPEARLRFESRYDEICCAESRILDHVEETLGTLQGAGVSMGVCTNKPTSFSRKILDALGLGGRFRAVVGPDLAGSRKPDGAHVLRTLALMECSPEHALFVGDMPIDVAAARSAGIPVAVLPTGTAAREKLEASSADYVLERFDELVPIVVPVAVTAGEVSR